MNIIIIYLRGAGAAKNIWLFKSVVPAPDFSLNRLRLRPQGAKYMRLPRYLIGLTFNTFLCAWFLKRFTFLDESPEDGVVEVVDVTVRLPPGHIVS